MLAAAERLQRTSLRRKPCASLRTTLRSSVSSVSGHCVAAAARSSSHDAGGSLGRIIIVLRLCTTHPVAVARVRLASATA